MLLYSSLIKVGTYFHCSERFLGLLAAFAADAAEISSAFTAFHFQQHDLGFGIILGSNIFNLASLLGLSALLTGALKFNHQEILLNGGISLVATVICTLLILGYMPPWVATLLLVFILTPYFALLISSFKLFKKLNISKSEKKFLSEALKDVGPEEKAIKKKYTLFLHLLLSIAALLIIFSGCLMLVRTSPSRIFSKRPTSKRRHRNYQLIPFIPFDFSVFSIIH